MNKLIIWFKNKFYRKPEEILDKYIIHVDGAFSSNYRNYGGYCAIVSRYDETKIGSQVTSRVICGGILDASDSNYCELRPVYEALSKYPKRSSFIVLTDYHGTVEFFHRCKHKLGFFEDWKAGKLECFKNNRKLLAEIEELTRKHEVEFMWIKGHTGSNNNEVCDELAKHFCALQMRNKKKELYSDNNYEDEGIKSNGNISITKPISANGRTVRKDA